MQIIAAPFEHNMITSNPQELEQIQEDKVLAQEVAAGEQEDKKDETNPAIDSEQNLYQESVVDIEQTDSSSQATKQNQSINAELSQPPAQQASPVGQAPAEAKRNP